MPSLLRGSIEINYETVGRDGPWIALIPGGRHALTDLESFADALASMGHRVITHDRRNCGKSSLDFDSLDPEDNVWADDLHALLVHLDALPAFVVGRSRGNRTAVRLALRHPNAVRGLLLWGLSGGPVAARFLDDYYYLKYLRAAKQGGMDAVCALDHFAGLAAGRPSNRRALLEMDPVKFVRTLSEWRADFLAGAGFPVMGISDAELRSIDVPTLLTPYYDRMHPHATVLHAHRMIRGSRFVDFDPDRNERPDITADEISGDTATVASILRDFIASLDPVPASRSA